MQENSAGAFRVAIKKTHADGTGYMLHYGPYAKQGTAKGILSSELGWMQRNAHNGTTVEGWLEQTVSAWTKVEL
jgi:hypothetical protein